MEWLLAQCRVRFTSTDTLFAQMNAAEYINRDSFRSIQMDFDMYLESVQLVTWWEGQAIGVFCTKAVHICQ